ncbi:MAG: sigma 54-interacting transcriptional regulator [Candidatus Hydrogenedentes bacterium]|nr:sigma 54-interacting transcriptional regulator [Candidatus Hydrogenedentota bacterium]
MSRPTKLSAQVFLELPPVLAHYLEANRAAWLEASPNSGRVSLLSRQGIFLDIEALAVERRHLLDCLGSDRTRALAFRMGFELGRRDAGRHIKQYDGNVRLALQAAAVVGQLQGRYVAEPIRFEFDLEEGTLYREVLLHRSAEAIAHQMVRDDVSGCVCWSTAGYFSGHVSEILGRAVICMEQECLLKGDPHCRFLSRLDTQWGEEANWARQALRAESMETELRRRDEMVDTAQRAARRAQVSLATLNRRLKTDLLLDNLIMGSEVMGRVQTRAKQLSQSDVPVFLLGEPGTGRGSLARAIHYSGRRGAEPFEVVDCRGVSAAQAVQELAGFEAGSFPGALRPHKGSLQRAGKGTVYLDEVTALSHEAQGLLLRAIERREVQPLGAAEGVPCDARVIAASQHEPMEKVADGELREDLYYALIAGRIDVPPLRARGEDILRLAHTFLSEISERYEKPMPRMGDDFARALRECSWPGNVRQLRNVIEHAVLFATGSELGLNDLPEDVLATRWVRPPQDISPDLLRAVLRRTRGNRSEAAEILGVGRTTLWRAMKRLGID